MEHYSPRDHATSNVLAWTATHSANVEPSVEEDAGADTDEPPDSRPPASPVTSYFKRTPIRQTSEHHESLLTKALQSHSDEDTNEQGSLRRPGRRRSITSMTSVASTADLTCGTGITTPARTNSPSPRLGNTEFAPFGPTAETAEREKDPVVQALEKKRCISFACLAKPNPDNKPAKPAAPQPLKDGVRVETAPRKTCIKFACLPQPPRNGGAQRRIARPPTPVPGLSPSTPKGSSNFEEWSSSTVRAIRSPTARVSPASPVASGAKKWLTADAKDLESECARFHEFATDELQEDDWILRDESSSKPKLTIDDTLEKENAIRKLGEEAEEEAELEEELDEEVDEEGDEEVDDEALIDDDDVEDESQDTADDDLDDEEDDDEDDDDGDEDDLDDDADTEHEWDDEASDGYKTDNETGFAESSDEDDDLVLWTTRIGLARSLSGEASMSRKLSLAEKSDASASSSEKSGRSRKKGSRGRPVTFRPSTPDLPDSTDFVCGTLDEDKPLEEAYISCVEARKRDKLRPIPQDIDPSFPTSEPEDEVEEFYRQGHGDSGDHLWLHGELEDLHHERDRWGHKKKGTSPMRYRSPPPRRRPSPAPKARGRSPRKLLDQRSPRLRSPAPLCKASKSPAPSPVHMGGRIAFEALAVRPGPTHTKSLPRAPGLLSHLRARKPKTGLASKETHVRGAIDIVKGLEQKRQRRREKFYQKYYSRARKEKAQARRPPPGQGAERMRELGLFMAGKAGHGGNYVLSI